MPAIGDTIRIGTISEQVIAQGSEAGYDVASLQGTEAKVIHTDTELGPIASMLGLPEGSIWIDAPTMPEGEFLLTPFEYELVA